LTTYFNFPYDGIFVPCSRCMGRLDLVKAFMSDVLKLNSIIIYGSGCKKILEYLDFMCSEESYHFLTSPKSVDNCQWISCCFSDATCA
jgi:hypothetical protein